MLAFARVTDRAIIGSAAIHVIYDVNTSWTPCHFHVFDLEAPIVSSLAQVGQTIKSAVIAWAATQGVTLAAHQVLVQGLGDDQTVGVRSTADYHASTIALSDVPEVTFLLAPDSHYGFRYAGAYTAELPATGLLLAINGPLDTTFVSYIGQVHSTDGRLTGMAAMGYDTVLNGGQSSGTLALPFWIEGQVSTGPNGAGVLALRVGSETNGAMVTIRRGTIGRLDLLR